MSHPTGLSVQLYTVRNALAEDFDGTLAKIAGFGYTQVEPFGLTDYADALRTGLSKHNLTAPSTHVGLLKGDQEEIFGVAKELGVSLVIDPHVDPARWESAEDVKQIAADLNAAAEKAAAHGLTVGYHNHWFELESIIDGKHALEVLADNLADGVVLEVDTYWAKVGGADVPALLQRLGEKVVALHIKDGDGTRDNKKQVPLGTGSIPIWEYVDAAPNALRVVELDDSEQDLIEAVGTSFAYLSAGKEA